MPDIFTEFRKAIERACNIPKPIDDIQYMPPLPGDMETGDFARLSLYLPDSNYLQFRDIVLKGGEQAGLERVRHYIWDSWAIAHYYDTRNELEGPDNASGLSAWLANGSISPRYLYHQVKRFESECMVNRSTYWLIFELLW